MGLEAGRTTALKHRTITLSSRDSLRDWAARPAVHVRYMTGRPVRSTIICINTFPKHQVLPAIDTRLPAQEFNNALQSFTWAQVTRPVNNYTIFRSSLKSSNCTEIFKGKKNSNREWKFKVHVREWLINGILQAIELLKNTSVCLSLSASKSRVTMCTPKPNTYAAS